MAGRVTHQQYYASIAKHAGIAFAADSPMALRARSALAEGDEHLNSILLPRWDSMAAALLPGIHAAYRAHGDARTPAGDVCVLKEAVRQAAEGRP
jgi:hypothetical protein